MDFEQQACGRHCNRDQRGHCLQHDHTVPPVYEDHASYLMDVLDSESSSGSDGGGPVDPALVDHIPRATMPDTGATEDRFTWGT